MNVSPLFPDREAFCAWKSIAYKNLDTLSTNFGAYLQSRGLKPRDGVAIMMPNLFNIHSHVRRIKSRIDHRQY